MFALIEGWVVFRPLEVGTTEVVGTRSTIELHKHVFVCIVFIDTLTHIYISVYTYH